MAELSRLTAEKPVAVHHRWRRWGVNESPARAPIRSHPWRNFDAQKVKERTKSGYTRAMHYQTAFDLAQNGYTGWLLPLAILAFGIGLGFTALHSEYEDERQGRGQFIVGAVASLLGVLDLISSYSDYRQNRDALDSGQFQTVEGQVENFQPLPKMESFDVSGTHFVYYPYELGSAFNRPFLVTDPVYESAKVRIVESNGKILRLEIAR